MDKETNEKLVSAVMEDLVCAKEAFDQACESAKTVLPEGVQPERVVYPMGIVALLQEYENSGGDVEALVLAYRKGRVEDLLATVKQAPAQGVREDVPIRIVARDWFRPHFSTLVASRASNTSDSKGVVLGAAAGVVEALLIDLAPVMSGGRKGVVDWIKRTAELLKKG